MTGIPDVLTETPDRARLVMESSPPSSQHHAMFDECRMGFHDGLLRRQTAGLVRRTTARCLSAALWLAFGAADAPPMLGEKQQSSGSKGSFRQDKAQFQQQPRL